MKVIKVMAVIALIIVTFFYFLRHDLVLVSLSWRPSLIGAGPVLDVTNEGSHKLINVWIDYTSSTGVKQKVIVDSALNSQDMLELRWLQGYSFKPGRVTIKSSGQKLFRRPIF